ncbi:MAG: type II secretion system F family protein [Phycisphaerales bacterium]|nr:type II secretion system F family protein [Phycisphaerales bacterium]
MVSTADTEKPSSRLSQFAYEAQSPQGLTLRGTLEAESLAAATSQLQSLWLRVLSIQHVPEQAAPRRLGVDDFVLFNQQLAHLTQAGLPVERGLRLIAADLRSGKLAAAANAVAADLERGLSLQEAFHQHANQFPDLYARLVDAGVKTGNLPGMLFAMGRHLELVKRVRFALWRVLTYPVMALVALAAVMLFVSMTVLPQLRDIYREFGGDDARLPLVTEWILAFGRYYPMILLVLGCMVVVIAAVLLLLRSSGRWGYFSDYVLLPMPVIGPVLKASLLARWCDGLRIGVASGLDLPQAIALTSDAMASPKLQQDARRLTTVIATGQKFDQFRSHLLPATVPAAIELSGQSGDLASTLAIITQMYEQQAEQRLKMIPVILTPVMMVVVVCGIGLTITALFMPLVKIITSLTF